MAHSRSALILAAAQMLALVAGNTFAQSFFFVQGPLPSGFGSGTYSRTVGISDTGSNGVPHAIGYGDDAGGLRNFEWWSNSNTSVMSWQGATPYGGWITKFPTAVDATALWQCGYGDTFVPDPPFGSTVGPRGFRENVNSGTNNSQVLTFGYAQFSDARGISNSGDIVVGRQWQGPFEYAYRFNFSTFQLQDLGTLPSQFGSAALAVSGDGNTVVGRSGNQAFSWRPSEGMLSLGSLPGQSSAVATCTDGNGLTIAGISNNGLDRGFRWSPIVGMQQIPNLPGGVQIRPHAMDGGGGIIGGQSLDASGNITPFIWTPTLGTQTLVSHLLGRGLFAQLGNIVFTDVTGISSDGRNICGLGTSGGVQVGWVARNLQCGTMSGTPGTQYVCLGGNVNVIAVGPNGGTLITMSSFQWYHNNVLVVAGTQPGGSVIANASTNVLSITGATASDVGTYFCIASSAGTCPVQGPNTSLQLQPAPSVTLQPVDTQVCANQVASFTTLGTAVTGTPVYRWQKHVPPFPNVYTDIFDGPTGNGSTFSGTGSATLSISNVQPADAERYRCLVSDSACGPGNYESTNRVLLTVNSLTQIVGPMVTQGCLGRSASLTVTASPANVTYQWQRLVAPFPNVYANVFDGPTGNGSTFFGAQTATLSVNGLTAADLTRYRCVVTGPCSSNISANALLTTYDIPGLSGLTGDVYVCQNMGAASFSVFVGPGNYGLLSYQWYGPSGPLTDGPAFGGHFYSGSATPTLTVSNMSFAAVGGYSVVVSGWCGGFATAPLYLTYCPGDFNCDGEADFNDYLDFVDAYAGNFPSGDFNHDEVIDFNDYLDFVDALSIGC